MKLICPSCGDNLRYRVKEQDSFCSTCKMSFPIQEKAFDIHDFVCRRCSSCGAEIISDDEARVVVCEYCGSKEFQTVTFENGFYPVGVIPFQIIEEEAKNIFHSAMKSAGVKLDDYVEIIEIERFYVPYSYEYQFFDNRFDTFQKNLGKINENDQKIDGGRKGKDLFFDKLITRLHIDEKKIWRFYDYSQMLFQILPFSIQKASSINPIYLDYASALNVKQEYVKDRMGSRKPEYYWVPIYKISFKAPVIENSTYFKNELNQYVMLINGETKEFGTTYEYLHRAEKEKLAKSMEEVFSKKEMDFRSYFTLFILVIILSIIVICVVLSLKLFSNPQHSFTTFWLPLCMIAVPLAFILKQLVIDLLRYFFQHHD